MSKNQSLSLRTQWLGERLKEARISAKLTLRDVGDQLQLADTSLSRFEKGTARIRRPYVKEMIDFYGVSDTRQREALLQLNEDAWRKDWWDGDTSDLESGFLDYTWLETRAEQIYAFSPMLIPGLLQTRPYAAALTTAGLYPGASNADIERMVDLRMTRQRILGGDSPTQLTVVLEETPLRRMIGTSEIHSAQLSYLLSTTRRKHIDLRILPTGGWHPGLDGPFSWFRLPDPYPDVAYVENLTGRTFLEAEAKVARFQHAYDEIYRSALSRKASTEFIKTVMKEFE